MKQTVGKRVFCLILSVILVVMGIENQGEGDMTARAAGKLKTACGAAVRATGNFKKLTYKSTTPSDFDAISFRHDRKVSALYYVTNDNTVYNVCVAKAKTTAYAKKLYQAFVAYKKDRLASEYFKKDFTKTEQNIMRNAIYGRKGKYVWYISMASKKKNQAGQAALKKKL